MNITAGSMLVKVIADIGRAGASLSVTCLNCERKAFVKARLLAARFGGGWPLEDLQHRFRCSICHASNVRFGLALPELAERSMENVQWFGGVYANKVD